MEEIEGNKLIAEFMGYKYNKNVYSIPEFERAVMGNRENAYEGNDHYHYDMSDIFKVEELLFNESFDWIMPVIKQIIKLSCLEEPIFHKINDLKDAMLHIEIELMWEELVKFIKWYNTQNNG